MARYSLRWVLLLLAPVGACAVSMARVDAPPAPKDQVNAALKLVAQGKLAEAESLLAKTVEDHPKAPVAWLQLGLVRQAQKKFDGALEAYGKASEFSAVKPIALYNSACVYALQKDTEKAFAALQQATAAGFADRGTVLADPDLAGIRGDKRFAGLVPPLLTGTDLFAEPVKLLLTLNGEKPNDEFGWVARKVGDLDGDKVIDFVATAPGFGNHAGKVYVYSSRRGQLLFAREGPAGQRYGNSAGAAGDVNGDGIPDLIVGGPQAGAGIAEVLSGKDGSVVHALRGAQQGGQFGYKVCGLGDIDGDGRADVAVTALAADGKQPGSGRCFVYSGKGGKQLFALDGGATGDKFGSAVVGSTSAKHPMLVVGAQDAGPQKRGRVYVYHFTEGAPKLAFTIEAEETAQNLGMMFLSFPGDFNGDGVPDIYCSDFGDSKGAPGGGRVFVYSGKDGKKLLDVSGTQPGEGLGTSPSDAGDVDGDGIGDLIVGAWQNREKAPSGGKVYLYSGASGKSLAAWTCKQHGDTFGFDATGIGDVDGDGRIDFLLTSAWSPVHGPKTGRVFILAGPEVPKR
jgi:hypothetical protein